jgi:hypothetical protein
MEVMVHAEVSSAPDVERGFLTIYDTSAKFDGKRQ